MIKKFQISPCIKNLIIVFTIVSLTILSYWGIHNHQFLNFDDDVYIQTNYFINKGITVENIKWAFGFNSEFYWHPMTWLSMMLDCQIFGLKAGPMLVENLIFHILNAVLLFFILFKITGERYKAAFVALLFAVHPDNVESVAWLVERKAVLSGFFLMLCMYLFLIYIKNKKIWIYIITIFLFAIGIMAKPIIMILPLLLLILDYWPLNRFNTGDLEIFSMDISFEQKIQLILKSKSACILYEKIPFAIISCVSVILSMLSVQSHHIVVSYQAVPFFLRIENFFVTIFQYFYTAIWPVNMSIFHPFPQSVPFWQFLAAAFFTSAIFVITILMRKKRPWLLAGWLWFLIALLPASGLVQAGLWPAYAHRFMYLPLIGLFIILIWEADKRLKGQYSVFLKISLFTAIIVYFSMVTNLQNTYYSNSYSLFHRALQVDQNNAVAINNIGVALAGMGKDNEAISYFKHGIELYPARANYYLNYAVCMVEKRDDEKATELLLKAITLDPRLYGAYLNLGLIQSRRGHNKEAIELIREALAIRQSSLSIRYSLGNVLVKNGNYSEAIDQFSYIVKRDPDNIAYRMNLALAYQDAGKLDEAMKEYAYLDRTIKKNKGFIYYNMASVYSMKNNFQECMNYLEMAKKNKFDMSKILMSDKRFEKFRNNHRYASFNMKLNDPVDK